MKDPLLVVTKLTKSYPSKKGSVCIVNPIDFEIAQGEFVCLIGHSGCGKTTVLNMVAGLTTPTGGEIKLDGRKITGPGPDRGVVFQGHALLPHLTALDNVLLAVENVYPQLSRTEQKETAAYFLNLVGLEKSKNQRAADLSAGMRQRVGVARGFAVSPRLLLLDEPFGSLDFITRFGLQKTLMDLCHESGVAALMVTHDVDEAILLADRVIMMTNGPEAEIGEIAEVTFDRPRHRSSLLHMPEYYQLRENLIDFLEQRAERKRPN